MERYCNNPPMLFFRMEDEAARRSARPVVWTVIAVLVAMFNARTAPSNSGHITTGIIRSGLGRGSFW